MTRLMRAQDIPAFVQDIVDTGCDIRCIADRYIIGDGDLPPPVYERVAPQLREICKRYGERDHLLPDIAAHLEAIGRVYREPLN